MLRPTKLKIIENLIKESDFNDLRWIHTKYDEYVCNHDNKSYFIKMWHKINSDGHPIPTRCRLEVYNNSRGIKSNEIKDESFEMDDYQSNFPKLKTLYETASAIGFGL